MSSWLPISTCSLILITQISKINTIQWALNQAEASIHFQRLILNKDFRDEFAQRFATHLNLTFNPGRAFDSSGGRVLFHLIATNFR